MDNSWSSSYPYCFFLSCLTFCGYRAEKFLKSYRAENANLSLTVSRRFVHEHCLSFFSFLTAFCFLLCLVSFCSVFFFLILANENFVNSTKKRLACLFIRNCKRKKNILNNNILVMMKTRTSLSTCYRAKIQVNDEAGKKFHQTQTLRLRVIVDHTI